MKIALILVSFLSLGHCGENSVSINVKNVINTVSDKFISFEMNFHDLMSLFRENRSFDKLNLISPAFIKLQGLHLYLKDENYKKYNDSEVALLFKTLK